MPDTTTKFKPGDKVRRIGLRNGPKGHVEGDIGVVIGLQTRIGSNLDVAHWLEFENAPDGCADNYELVVDEPKFKVGDRVRIHAWGIGVHNLSGIVSKVLGRSARFRYWIDIDDIDDGGSAFPVREFELVPLIFQVGDRVKRILAAPGYKVGIVDKVTDASPSVIRAGGILLQFENSPSGYSDHYALTQDPVTEKPKPRKDVVIEAWAFFEEVAKWQKLCNAAGISHRYVRETYGTPPPKEPTNYHFEAKRQSRLLTSLDPIEAKLIELVDLHRANKAKLAAK